MTNFRIVFANAWFLLLLIPLLALALFPYFRMAKKYRRTRNRITSVVLHSLVAVLVVCLVAGMCFTYDLPNEKNELMLVVDVSQSGRAAENDRDKFVRSLIDEASAGVNVGVVTFGYDQVYASPLSTDKNAVYDGYKSAKLPDVNATDIAAALRFAQSKLNYPESAKIVLVSDGAETDEKAIDVISSVSAAGIRVDTRYVPHTVAEQEVQISSVDFPEEEPSLNVLYNFTVGVRSSYVGEVLVTMYDNDEPVRERLVALTGTEQNVPFACTFTQNNLHKLTFSLTTSSDAIEQNNTFVTYRYIEVYDKILVVEKYDGESAKYIETLDNESYEYTVINVADVMNMPKSAEDLCAYDEVVLFNIASADLPEGFAEALTTYVGEYGGGLFTVGGNKQGETSEGGLPVPNAYNRSDMTDNLGNETLLQQLLPVSATDYTPPTGIMFVIDVSGSMEDDNRLEAAKQAMLMSLKKLNRRDWVGVMTLDESYGKVLKLTPVPQLPDIEAAIQSLGPGGGTYYTAAIQSAGTALAALNTVQLKHIVLISDAKADSLDDPEKLWDYSDETTGTYKGGYGGAIQDNFNNGITCSIVDLSGGKGQTDNMIKAAEVGHGKYLQTTPSQSGDLAVKMVEAVTAAVVPEVARETYSVKVGTRNEVLSGVDENAIPSLDGYYGLKTKSGATTVLTGPYNVPVYAQWNFGKGKVGSFACDLEGTWSSAFLNDDNGAKILQNIVTSLFPASSVRAPDIQAEITRDNYRAHLSVFTRLNDGDKVRVTVDGPVGEGSQTNVYELSPSDGFSRITFETKTPGVYAVTVEKIGADGSVESCVLYTSFAYSAEYDGFVDPSVGQKLLSDLSSLSNGNVIADGEEWKVYDDFEKTVHKSYDPRIVLAACAIVLFLLDIAVRKFKFKWLHELFRKDVQGNAAQAKGGEQK